MAQNNEFDDGFQHKNHYNDDDYFVTDEQSPTEVMQPVAQPQEETHEYDQTEFTYPPEEELGEPYENPEYFNLSDFHYENLSPQDTYGGEWVTRNAYDDLYENTAFLDNELATVSRDSRAYYNEVSRLQSQIEAMSEEDQKNSKTLQARQQNIADKEDQLRLRESEMELTERKNNVWKWAATIIAVITTILFLTFLVLWTNARTNSSDVEGQKEAQTQQVQQMKDQLEAERQSKAEAETQVKDQQTRIDGLNKQVSDLNREREDQKKRFDDQENQLKELEQQVKDMDEIDVPTVTTTVESRSVETQTLHEQSDPVTVTATVTAPAENITE